LAGWKRTSVQEPKESNSQQSKAIASSQYTSAHFVKKQTEREVGLEGARQPTKVSINLEKLWNNLRMFPNNLRKFQNISVMMPDAVRQVAELLRKVLRPTVLCS
jgi:hypothetical protein